MVLWLQGGPGSPSLYGMLRMHGPFILSYDEHNNTKAVVNPHAWTKKANMLYIDNPVGAGGFKIRLSTVSTNKVKQQHRPR